MNHCCEKKIVTVWLFLIVFAGSLWSAAYQYADEIITSVNGDVKTEWVIKKPDGTEIPTYSATASNYLQSLPFKREMINVSGALAKNLGMREIHKNNGGSVLKNGYVAGIYPYTTTDYEMEQMKELKEFLDERGIQLLYVNEPTKYIDDSLISEDLGCPSFVNDNADRFLAGLEENGIGYIDLRDYIAEQNLDSFQLFYKTDHHWTTSAGKMAAEVIAKELNDNYGYQIDLSLYGPEKFTYKEYKNAWLGEQGKKFGSSFVGMDDFTLILPKYDTSFEAAYTNGIKTGSFEEALVDQSYFLPENNEDIYNARSWHYSYAHDWRILNGIRIRNNMNTEGKKVLVLGDSYEQVTVPFLSLGISEVRCLVLRSYSGSLREYIDQNDIDTVVVAYAAFMIGAHDNEGSANYAMFDFH